MAGVWRRLGAVRPGAVVKEYELLDVVGSGSFGTVWKARRTRERLREPSIVALKQTELDRSDLRATLRSDRALDEGRIAQRLAGVPQVIAVRDVFEQRGCVWLVEEFFDAMSLQQLIDVRGRLEPEEVAWIGAQIATALEAAHDRGIVHRDISAANILVGRDGETAKLADFGVARQFGDPHRTAFGAMVGTPAYKSPDEARGGRSGPASDVFSLAAVLYHAVEGRTPFGEHEPENLLDRIRAGRIPPATHAGPLREILEDGLQATANTRPSATDMAERLHELHGGPSEVTRRVLRRTEGAAATTEPGPVAPPARARRRWALGAVAAVLLLVAGIAVGVTWPASAPAPTAQVAATPAPDPGPEGLPASVPTIAVTGDRKALDPCRLLDLRAIGQFGPTVVGPGQPLSGCSAYLGTFTDYRTSVQISFADAKLPNDSALTVRGEPLNLGGVEVKRYAPRGQYCHVRIQLSDTTPIWVLATNTASEIDTCRVADVAADGAVRELARSGLSYDAKRLSRIRVATLDPCFSSVPAAQLDAAFPGLGGNKATHDQTDMSCRIADSDTGLPGLDLRWEVWPSSDKTSGSRVVPVGRHTLEVLPETADFDEPSCTGYLLLKTDSNAAPGAAEYLSMLASGKPGSTGTCDRLIAAAKVLDKTLPAKL
ncbi:serine/threonine-protein kinase [Pseudonocardia phyllosphaerae]|uniref:serine/threonine-protein kinase n=1 Tax=Pseudonocardia phyllosphaerae TaxID=3390502 RepID=UPI00397D4481